MHHVSLEGLAGVERHFAAFVDGARARYPDWTHSWFNPARSLHPAFADLHTTFARTVHAKYRRGVKLPSLPVGLRTWHARRELAGARPGAMLIWNRTAKLGGLLDALDPARCIHWEHGAAWHAGHERERADYLRRVPHAIASSRAAGRVLELMWGYEGRLAVCRNALRPDLMPNAPTGKGYPREGPIRLGIAARLMPVKGVPLVLHALARLRGRTDAVELHVAGAGPDRDALGRLADRIGVGPAVRFHGSVADMSEFYGSIHCLVHPPLTEAFGLVGIEAAAHGVPVIAVSVDGLPESVTDGVTGTIVEPTLPLSAYPALGGRLDGIPETVYDPRKDALAAPRLVDPDALADAVERLFASESAYEALSCSASGHVRAAYRFDAHVDEVMRVVESVARGTEAESDAD